MSKSHVELVGVLNITPDSFSDGGEYNNPHKAIEHTNELFNAGASIVDIGAESTRPGAEPLSADKEWHRLEPILRHIITAYPDHISIDTHHPKTVRRATAEIGSFIVNDITGFNSQEMIDTVAELRLPCIVSHLPKAAGQNIQGAHKDKSVNSVDQVVQELMTSKEQLISAGVDRGAIILDPGIGFGKTTDLNWKLIEFARFVPDIPVMIGYSRKRFLGENRMEIEPNLEAGRVAVATGAKYLRVHDVKGHAPLIS